MKDGQLNNGQIEQFFSKGFLVVDKYFSEDELKPVIEEVSATVDEWANKLYNAGKITKKYQDSSFHKRIIHIENEFPGASILIMKRGFVNAGVKRLWCNERLLNVIEQLIGPEISGHPVWNLRCKIPRNEEVTVPWHQDNGYFDTGSDEILIPTAWIPLVDATKENGCLVVAQGGHQKGVTINHTCCVGPTWYIQCEEIDMAKELDVDFEHDLITCEVPLGGMLLINNLIPHKSLQNYTDSVRWSIDLRWHITGTNNHYHGLKESIEFRSSVAPIENVNWKSFEGNEEQHTIEARLVREAVIRSNSDGEKPSADYTSAGTKDPFDTSLTGPWMLRWEIVNHNRHTDAMAKKKEAYIADN